MDRPFLITNVSDFWTHKNVLKIVHFKTILLSNKYKVSDFAPIQWHYPLPKKQQPPPPHPKKNTESASAILVTPTATLLLQQMTAKLIT